MNKADLQKILLEEIETAINEEELDENFFKKMAAKLRGAKDGGWEAVAAQGDEEEPSSKQAGATDTEKIPVRPMIAKLLGAGLPTKIANELGKEIINQLTNVHGFGEASIQEQAGGLKGVARQPSARRTSSMPSGKKVLDLSAVKIPKNMVQNIENLLSDMFSSYGFRGVKLGQGPEVEPQKKATPSDAPETTKSDAEPEKSRLDLIKPPRSLRDIRGSQNYKKFMASLLDFFANESKIDINIAKKIVRDIWSKTPTSGRFDKIIFKEAMEKEIDVAAILADSGLNLAQQIKVLGDLKNWASQNSDIVGNKITKIKKLQKPEQTKEGPNFHTENGIPLNDAARDMLLKKLADSNVTKGEFEEAYRRLRASKYSYKENGSKVQTLDQAISSRDPQRISGFGRGDDFRVPIRQNFLRLYVNNTNPRSVVGPSPSTTAALSAELKEQLNRMQTLAGINKKVL